jgi:hypothetical protein
MEIYLEFLHKILTCRRCKKQDPVVYIARNPKQTKKLSPTQNCMDPGSLGGFKDRWIDPDGSTLDPTVRGANQLNQTGSEAYIRAWRPV